MPFSLSTRLTSPFSLYVLNFNSMLQSYIMLDYNSANNN
nr:MAG TPA: hypothetical protein [Caudoviricetes sp.]